MRRKKLYNTIIETAKKMFLKLPYSDINVSDIAKEAKISRGTFYMYFKNKRELFLNIAQNFISSLTESLKNFSLKEWSPDKSNIEEVTEFLYPIVKTILSYKEIAKMALYQCGIGDEEKQKLKDLTQEIFEIIKEKIDFGIQNGYIRKEVDSEIASHIIMGTTKELMNKWLENELKEEEIKGKIASTIDIILFGMYNTAKGETS